MTFRTLPIKRYGVIGGQDVNIVDPAALKAIVRAAFYPAPRSRHAPGSGHAGHQPPAVRAGATTVDVLNGGSTAGLAGRVSAAVTSAGYRAGQVGNTSYRTSTAVLYGQGEAANAGKIAAAFGVTAAPGTSVAAGHVEILLGASAVVPAVSASAKPHSRPAATPTTGPQGGAVRASSGIPCVN